MQISFLFPGGRAAALTMSYDDGPGADRKLVEIFNRYGIKGTFHLNGVRIDDGWQPDYFVHPEEVAELYRGHEVSCHTATHPWPNILPHDQLVWELTEDRVRLERLAGYPVRGMSYPYGNSTPEMRDMMPDLGLFYGRTANSTGWFGLPEDFLLWNPTCHHNQDIFRLGEALVDPENLLPQRLMYVWGHSYEFDNDDNWDRIERFCAQMGGRDDVWYATNIEIYDYVTAQRKLRMGVDRRCAYNPSAVDVWLRVDGQAVCVPAGKTMKW